MRRLIALLSASLTPSQPSQPLAGRPTEPSVLAPADRRAQQLQLNSVERNYSLLSPSPARCVSIFQGRPPVPHDTSHIASHIPLRKSTSTYPTTTRIHIGTSSNLPHPTNLQQLKCAPQPSHVAVLPHAAAPHSCPSGVWRLPVHPLEPCVPPPEPPAHTRLQSEWLTAPDKTPSLMPSPALSRAARILAAQCPLAWRSPYSRHCCPPLPTRRRPLGVCAAGFQTTVLTLSSHRAIHSWPSARHNSGTDTGLAAEIPWLLREIPTPQSSSFIYAVNPLI